MDLSRLIGRAIRDQQGTRIASIGDVIVRLADGEHPLVTGLVARLGRRDAFLPITLVNHLDVQGATISTPQLDVQPFQRRPGEVLLHNDLLDKQVIDLLSARVVRANELILEQRDNNYMLVGVAIGSQALLGRLLPWASHRTKAHGEVLDWANVEPFASSAPEALLSLSHKRLTSLNATDLARIADEVSYKQGVEMMDALDEDLAAEALEEMTEEFRADIVENMDEDRAADILESMAPDTAADVLGDLPDETADRLLAQMEPDDAEDVETLLGYADDSAGGLMTTEYFAMPADATVEETLNQLRLQLAASETDIFHYIYVITKSDPARLVGAVILRDLLLAEPGQLLADLPQRTIPRVTTGVPARDAARLLVDYNVLALPVVDDDDVLVGIITVDDAMELLVPEVSDRRLPRIFGSL